jgi:hypothetical protein
MHPDIRCDWNGQPVDVYYMKTCDKIYEYEDEN